MSNIVENPTTMIKAKGDGHQIACFVQPTVQTPEVVQFRKEKQQIFT